MLCVSCILAVTQAKAQWVVTDPGNLAQGIINATKNIVQTSSTATNMLNNFKEVQKVYNQGREYYDALKAVKNLVKDARKVQKTILMVGDITDIYVRNFEKMLTDDNFTVEELAAIANGYTKLLNESDDVLQELKGVVNASTLSLSDKERMEVVDNAYSKMVEYRSLVKYYTNKNISVSLLRAKEKNAASRVLDLYGTENERYW
jgi:conjugal transfer/entry exclusion protein